MTKVDLIGVVKVIEEILTVNVRTIKTVIITRQKRRRNNMEISRMFAFESAHYLPNHKGKCANLHGHNWKVKVTVHGFPIDQFDSPENGMVMDYNHLRDLVDPLIEKLDHHNLNGFMSNPTCENLVQWFGDNLTRLFEKAFAEENGRIFALGITIFENENSSCTDLFNLFTPKVEDET